MTAFGNTIGTRSAITITLNSLASATYVAGTAIDIHALVNSIAAPFDVVIELELTPGTVSGIPHARVMCQVSMDGSTYSTGPTSSTTTTDEPLLYLLGVLPLPTSSTLQRKGFPVLAALGFIPYSIKPVVFNSSGAAIASSGNAMNYTISSGYGS